MIFYILDAYEEGVGKSESFFKRIKKMNIVTQICMSGIVLLYIGIWAIYFIWKNALLTMEFMAGYVIISHLLMFVINRQRQKNYIDNVKEYNEKLDKLKILLETQEFKIDSEKKLEKLLEKIQKYLVKKEEEALERKINNREFANKILIPIVSFTLGAFVSKVSIEETVAMAIILLVLVIMFRFTYINLTELGREIFESKVTRIRCLYNELQDLYDRDYVE